MTEQTTDTSTEQGSEHPTEKKARRLSAAPIAPPVVDTNTSYDPFAHLGLRPSQLVNADPDRDYRYIVLADYFSADGVRLNDERNRLASRGFSPCNGPRAKKGSNVYHPMHPGAEIWERPIAIAEDEWRALRLARNILNPAVFVHYVAHPSEFCSKPLFAAAKAWHDKGLTAEQKPTRDEILALCRAEPVHPGAGAKARWER